MFLMLFRSERCAMKTINNPVPAFAMWTCNHLGGDVVLVRDWDEYGDGFSVLKPGLKGVLSAIQTHPRDGARAVVDFEGGREQVDLPFNRIRAA